MKLHYSSFCIGLFFLVLLITNNSHASTPHCANITPTVTITPFQDSETIDNQKSQPMIQQLSGLGQIVHSNRIPLAMGLTLTQVKTTTQITAQMESSWDGQKCASLKELVIGFGFSPHTIYIPSEFAPMSCAYNAIYSHEIRHVQTDRSLLSRQLPNVRKEIINQSSHIGVLHGSSEQDLQQQLRQKLEVILTSIQTTFTHERQREQALVDSPAEYARVGNSCNGMIQTIMRH
jgi:hypothetical protein